MNALIATTGSAASGFLVVALLAIIACAAGLFATLWDWGGSDALRRRTTTQRARTFAFIESERDAAAALGVDWRIWIGSRAGLAIVGFIAAFLSGIALLYVVAPILGWVGVRFALQGKAQTKRLRRERAFIDQLRNLRDRMEISNQSLDTALQEIGRNPGPDLGYVLAPFARGGSVVANIVDVGRRSRSPIIEYACGVLLWSRSRSLDSLIDAIDEILIPVSEAQLMVQEESQVTLTQQRAVTFAMAALMTFMFFVVVRVGTFAAYYRTAQGNVVLAIVIGMFFGLVWLLSVLVKVEAWTRWDLRQLASEQERLNA